MANPHVLVVMPLYNARPYVRAAVQSILDQTYTNSTLLVINDGSTDGSEQEVIPFLNKGVVLWHQENQGPGAAMNRAIAYAVHNGIHFIARIDSDDISMPDRFTKQIDLLIKHPEAAACSANCYYIDPESEKIIGTSTVSISEPLIHWEIRNGLRGLIQPVCMFRTEPLYSIGGYRKNFILAEEVDVFLRLSEAYNLINSAEFLAKIRINPYSLSMKNVQKNIYYQFYALDCAKNRRYRKPERDYENFSQNITPDLKFRIWREEQLLKLWRSRLYGSHLPTLLLAGLLDPRRVIIRLLRKLEERHAIIGGEQ